MSNIKETLEAVQGIVEAVPVYEDMLQPASKEVGKSLLTITKVVNVALSPLTGLVWGYEKIANYLETRMAEKLKDVPEENISTPPPSIAVPAIEALRYTGEVDELREMFSNLIATAMNKETTSLAHPSFVEIIKQLHPDEAKIIRSLSDTRLPLLDVYIQFENMSVIPIMQNFSDIAERVGCETPSSLSSYLINLSRLGLISIEESRLVNDESYDILLNHPVIIEAKQRSLMIGEKEPKIVKKHFSTTPFGLQFYRTCCVEFRHTVIPAVEKL